jgi:hypothetical protein
MAVPGLLIEYLINGALALVWLYPLLKRYDLSDPPVAYLAVYALGLYFVGMVVDIAAWWLTRSIKYRIRRKIAEKYGFTEQERSGSSHIWQVNFALYAPEVAKEHAMRSSRDRIARGAIVNSILATVIVLPIEVGIGCVLASIGMWIGFEKVSYAYELHARRLVHEKIQRERSSII